MTSYNFSLSNYDMLSGDMRDSLRLSANEAAIRSEVRPSLFTTPVYDLCANAYGSFDSNAWLLNPNLALGNLGNIGNMGSLGYNFFNWGNTTTSSSSTNEEDILAKEKYEKLKKLVEDMLKDDILESTDKAKLTAAKNKSGSMTERYEALKEAFEAIDQNAVKDYVLTKGQSIKINGKDLPEQRRLIGLGDGDKTIPGDKLNALTRTIDLLSSSNPDNMDGTSLFNDLNTGTVDILDLLSRYNSVESGNLMVKMIEKSDYDVAKRNIDIMVTKLIEKAQSDDIRKYLSAESIENLDYAINSLKNCSSYDSSKTAAFNELYRLTRLAAATDLDHRIKKDYGEYSSQVFGSNIFANKTIADLENEGFDVSSNEITVSSSASEAVTSSSSSSTSVARTAAEQATELVRNGVLVQSDVMYTIKGQNGEPLKDANGNEIQVRLYQEKYKSDDRDYQRVFYVHKGKMYELLGCDISNATSATFDKQVETNASNIRTAERVVDISELNVNINPNADVNLGSIEGYFDNKEVTVESCGSQGASKKADELINKLEASLRDKVAKQLREQGVKTNSTEFENQFKSAFENAKEHAKASCITGHEGKSSWNAFWCGEGLSGYKSSSSFKTKDLVDSFMTRFNENINNVIKNQAMDSIADKHDASDSTWTKIKKAAPWAATIAGGIAYIAGGPVGLVAVAAGGAIAAYNGVKSIVKSVGKWLGF